MNYSQYRWSYRQFVSDEIIRGMGGSTAIDCATRYMLDKLELDGYMVVGEREIIPVDMPFGDRFTVHGVDVVVRCIPVPIGL